MSILRTIESLLPPPGAYLATIDIKSLYNSIPHGQGLEITKTYLDQIGADSAPFNGFILKLSHNAFLFYGVPLLQLQSVAMGTPPMITCTPPSIF